MLSRFIDRFYSDDLDAEEKSLIDNLARLSNPEGCTREGYADTMDSVFGKGTSDFYDRRDIDEMVGVAKKSLPSAIADTFNEIEEEVKEKSLEYSKDMHLVALAASTSAAIEDMTDKVITPSTLLEPFVINNTAYGAAEILSDHLEEDDSDESDSDDYGFDEDEYYD